MPHAFLPDLRLHYLDHGPKAAPALVLAHPLGLDLTIWDALIPLLPPGLRVIRYDHRGHGRSDIPPAPYPMGALVRDAEHLLDHLGIKDCVFLGASMGGMVAQGLAVKRLDLIRALILSNTAPKIGHEGFWATRIAELRAQGLVPIAPKMLKRLLAPATIASPVAAKVQALLEQGHPEGYLGCAAAIMGTDFYTPTASLRLPTLAIASSADAITPADMVRELGDLIAGSQFHLIRKAGHLPYVEQPQAFAQAITHFLTRIAHL